MNAYNFRFSETGEESLGGVRDYRDRQEGITYRVGKINKKYAKYVETLRISKEVSWWLRAS